MKVIVLEKHNDGELRTIDEREWNADMITALQHANYLTLGGKEYEMLEGRLHLEKGALELLVAAVTK